MSPPSRITVSVTPEVVRYLDLPSLCFTTPSRSSTRSHRHGCMRDVRAARGEDSSRRGRDPIARLGRSPDRSADRSASHRLRCDARTAYEDDDGAHHRARAGACSAFDFSSCSCLFASAASAGGCVRPPVREKLAWREDGLGSLVRCVEEKLREVWGADSQLLGLQLGDLTPAGQTPMAWARSVREGVDEVERFFRIDARSPVAGATRRIPV